MKTRLSAAVLLLGLFCPGILLAQDFSNKGKDFWVGYGLHCQMFQGSSGGTQDMVLYFATEAVTNVRVEIPALGYVQNYSNIPANTIFTTNTLPKTGSQDSRLMVEGISDKGIHITSDQPIVAYAHIYNGSISGATLLFPTNTLGKEYYSLNFEQHSNQGHSNCFFYAIAADTGTTTIEVIPSANTQNMTAGNTYTFNLTQGQVFNALGTINGNDGVDLTGSRIRSISTGTGGCKRIAVFSGSGKINIHCPLGPTNNSADNYMVQAFPKSAWGKYFLTVPTSRMPNNFFRVAVSDPATVVKLNGTVLTGLTNNFYYQIGQTGTPNLIEADKPIMVAQYITSANQCGNTSIGGNGDPEMIYLSPVEQNIDRVILNSTPNYAIASQYHYVNVVIPNSGTAISSFRIDGLPPSTSFVTHPQNPNYSYLVQNVSPGAHIIQSDSSFNAIAYGYGSAESYGYNAGANVKDLYQFISIQNQFATVNFPAACKGSPFNFALTFPYQPAQIKWIFNGLFADVVENSPVYDSTWTVNGKQLYKYKLPGVYTLNTVGTFQVKVIAQNPTPDGCSGEQEINYDLQVFDHPIADFNISSDGCVSDSVRFLDNSNTNGRTINSWFWDFGDGSVGATRNPVHKYAQPGNDTIKYSVITDIGCLSDTVSKILTLANPPVAKFGITHPLCLNRNISFSDSSYTFSGNLIKWYWDFGDGSTPVVATSGITQTHSYTATGNYTVTLKVENTNGCQSALYSMPVTITANPVAGFNFGNACLPGGAMQFTNTSTISDGTGASLIYLWNFGDGSAGSGNTNPIHNYNAVGPFPASLVVFSNAGCSDSILKSVNTIYSQPQAGFTVADSLCFGSDFNFTDQSNAPNSTITNWAWDFGDGTNTGNQNPVHNYSTPGTYTINLTVTSAIGCLSQAHSKTVVVHALPVSGFTVSGPYCANRDIVFTDASTPGSGTITLWNWDFGDGNTQVKNSASPFTHNYSSAGTYTVTLITRTDRGCESVPFTRQVIVHPLPQPGFAMPDNCLADPWSQFTDTSSIADGTESGFTYLWNFGDATSTPANPNTATIKNPKHKYPVVGPYDVSLTVTSANGCVASITQTFIVNSSQPVPAFTLNSNPVCSNQAVALTNQSTIDIGRIAKMEIYWDFVNDPSNKTVVSYPVGGSVYNHSYPEFFTPATRDYQVKMVVYSGDNCFNATSQILTVKATPELSFTPLAGVCADQPAFQILEAGVLNGMDGNTLFTGAGVSASGFFNPQNAGLGNHLIRYSFTASNGCSNYKEQNITVFAVPVVSAGPDRFVLEGGNAVLLGNGNGNGLSYTWSPATWLNNAAIEEPLTTPADDITYTLKATSSDGCVASDQVFVRVLKSPLIPNTFSPNGDGIHDRWEIRYLESYPGATVEIYNRYGQLVFQSTGYSVPWDGTYKGKDLPAGTYYYLINPKNGRKQMTGFVDIIR